MTLEYYRPERATNPSGNWVLSVAYLLAGVAVPAVCFTVSLIGGSPLSPEWQNGESGNLLKLQLEGKVAWPFFPLLLYSMVSMTLAVVRPQRFSHIRAVRIGVFGGVILAAQYVVIMQIALGGGDAGALLMAYFFVGAGPIVGVLIFRTIVRNFRSKLTWAITTPLGIAALVLLLLIPQFRRQSLLGTAFFVMLGAGPLWALMAYSWLSGKLWRENGPQRAAQRLQTFVPFLGWLAAYGIAWRLAVLRAVHVYVSLPTAPNRCYVCTAAANGHPSLVGSRTIRGWDGSFLRINEQLCRLKLAEIAMIAVMPGAHQACRRLYDATGPVLASYLKHPVAADLAYLSLKPAEWMSLVFLRLLISNPTTVARSLIDRSKRTTRAGDEVIVSPGAV